MLSLIYELNIPDSLNGAIDIGSVLAVLKAFFKI